LAAVSDTFGYLRHPVVQPIIIPAETRIGKTSRKKKTETTHTSKECQKKEKGRQSNKKIIRLINT
jgi:hypothetical protein